MNSVKFDLTIRLDESGRKFVFFTTRVTEGIKGSSRTEPEFAVEISLDDLNEKGIAGAERLIGKSVLGFFDHLTEGTLDLPKHYR